MIHSAASLASLKLAEIKVIASELSIIPEGNKSKRETFITAILEFQSAQVIVQVPTIKLVQPTIEVPVVYSTFDADENVPPCVASTDTVKPKSSPVLIVLVAVAAVLLMGRVLMMVGSIGFDLSVRGADGLIGAWYRWSERLPQPDLVPIPA